jgi:gliding motility-associated-like protein
VATVIANTVGSDTSCFIECFFLDATASVNAATYNWLEIGIAPLLSTNDTITVCPATRGTHFYALIATNVGCADTDTVVIHINTPPIADAGTEQTILQGNTATIGGLPTGPVGATYSWWPQTGVGTDTSLSNPTVEPTITTIYNVLVTDTNGCADVDSVLVTVVPDVIVPSGISPNGDGQNEEWIIGNIEIFPDCVVEVYNRWGELLFQSKGYPTNQRWKGLYNGKPLPVGTYYYIINLNNEFFPDALTGPITIVR